MSGRFIFKAELPVVPHRCDPPYYDPGDLTEADAPLGSIWQCNCGRTWVVTKSRSGLLCWTPEGRIRRFIRTHWKG